MYRSWRTVRLRYEIVRLLTCLAIAIAFVLVHFSLGIWDHSRIALLPIWFLVAFAAMVAARMLGRMVLRIRRASGHDRRSVAFAGCTDVAVNLHDTFRAHGWMGIDVVGYFDDRAPSGARPLAKNAKLEGQLCRPDPDGP